MTSSVQRTIDLQDALAGIAFMGIAVAFWIQRDYTSRYSGLLPDVVLYGIVTLGALLLVSGVGRRGHTPGPRWPSGAVFLVAAMLLLLGWFAVLPFVGFSLAGFVFFTLIATLMRSRRTLSGLLVDAGVALGTISAIHLVFVGLLHVQLPGLSL